MFCHFCHKNTQRIMYQLPFIPCYATRRRLSSECWAIGLQPITGILSTLTRNIVCKTWVQTVMHMTLYLLFRTVSYRQVCNFFRSLNLTIGKYECLISLRGISQSPHYLVLAVQSAAPRYYPSEVNLNTQKYNHILLNRTFASGVFIGLFLEKNMCLVGGYFQKMSKVTDCLNVVSYIFS